MAKRVAFLRLLLCGCDLALLDEPFVGLDRDLRDILAAMLVEKIEQQGMACILVTHDRFEAARLSREIMQLSPKWMDVQNVITLPTPLSERNFSSALAFWISVIAIFPANRLVFSGSLLARVVTLLCLAILVGSQYRQFYFTDVTCCIYGLSDCLRHD